MEKSQRENKYFLCAFAPLRLCVKTSRKSYTKQHEATRKISGFVLLRVMRVVKFLLFRVFKQSLKEFSLPVPGVNRASRVSAAG